MYDDTELSFSMMCLCLTPTTSHPKLTLISTRSSLLILSEGTHYLKGMYPNQPLDIFGCTSPFSERVFVQDIWCYCSDFPQLTLRGTVAPVWISVLNLKSMSVSGSHPPHWGLNQQMKRRTIFWFLSVMFIFHYSNFSETKLQSHCVCSCPIPPFFLFSHHKIIEIICNMGI